MATQQEIFKYNLQKQDQKSFKRSLYFKCSSPTIGTNYECNGAITTREGVQFSQTILSKGGQAADP